MSYLFSYTFVCIISLVLVNVNNSETFQYKNERPIVGIIAQEVDDDFKRVYPGVYHSYIAASYVKLVEGGGARAVPVWIGKDRAYYEHIVNSTNGILFPGGLSDFNKPSGYAEAALHLYKLAIEQNQRGIYYPIFGICLGFEFLVYAMADNQINCRTKCRAYGMSLPLKFTPNFRKSKLYENLSENLIDKLRFENLTANSHNYCVTERTLHYLNITKQIHVLSLSQDPTGLNFISSFESRLYPFYGLQFHPEKSLYEWIANTDINHTPEAIEMGQYFANMFVNETKKNSNKFQNKDQERKHLIYNYPKTFTAADGIVFQECYLFKNGDDE